MRAPRGTIAVVGGGVSGLAVAYEIAERAERVPGALEVVCYEAAPHAGGNIRSTLDAGFLCEWGPNGFLDSARHTVLLVRRLGLEARQVKADPSAALRWIFRSGKLRRVPDAPRAFLASDVLSLAGKLRVALEPLVPPRRGESDESVHGFASRRIGREAADVLVGAMVAGVYAGNAREISLEATFPKMREMERTHGSLFRALLARRREARDEGAAAGGPGGPAGTLTSFRGGLQELTDALAGSLGPRLRTGVRVTAIHDLGDRGFRLMRAEGPPVDVGAVVVACPAWDAAPLLRSLDPPLADTVGTIEGAPIAVVHLGYRRDALGEMPRGFGFLVPRGQGVRILGTLWASNLFEGRAPGGSVLLTAMVGGAHDPAAAALEDGELVGLVRRDLRTCMELRPDPYFVRVFRHPRGIPQYSLGHPARLRAIDDRLRELPGLWLCGNSYRGVSINACVEEAPRVAEAALGYLDRGAAALSG